jgi:hypothetical protein
MIDKERSSPLQQVDGEKPATARDEGAAIIRHDQMVSRPTMIVGGLRFANPPYELDYFETCAKGAGAVMQQA